MLDTVIIETGGYTGTYPLLTRCYSLVRATYVLLSLRLHKGSNRHTSLQTGRGLSIRLHSIQVHV